MKSKIFLDKIEEDLNVGYGLYVRKLVVKDYIIHVAFISQITDKNDISGKIISPLLQYDKDDITIEIIAHSIIYTDNILIDEDENKILSYIYEGNSIIIVEGENSYIATNVIKKEKRNIETPQFENSIRAPLDAFNEDLNTNLNLIRSRMKDTGFKVEKFIVGTRTKTNIALAYVIDIANDNYVNEIRNRIEGISIDGIFESGYIEKIISNKKNGLFPEMGITEKADTVGANLLEGKVCILIDGSNLALLAPKTFIEFFDSGEDHYSNTYFSTFVYVTRLLSFIITLTLSPMYVSIVSFHPDVLPSQYILALASTRAGVPVNAITEAFIMEIVVEILREASIRLPKKIGPAIGIVGTIVIGQAAVIAGLVSPLMVIIVSLGSITSFVAPDYTVINPVRILKFFMIIITGMFGLYGVAMGLTIILINLISTYSITIPYMAPVSPSNFKEILTSIYTSLSDKGTRPKFMKTKDKKRR
ncbi:spore germination protein [Clostridium algidicarnis]|uniref:spore germination protein n=1 Tax=Clostridium algidicarnis TaxID=37659 RepID=UPI001623B6F5|nr:spore germination protein [Clostridium algidicarnis]MBB6696454.1 spore germination protein [Clostridium algidicarnis]MBU3205781.1 spore germination protein [Clostridium algidicarnis]